MIYTYQIIDGFESLLGPETIHIPMLISLLTFMGYPEGEESYEISARKLWWYSVLFHFFCAVHRLLRSTRWVWAENVAPLLSVLLIVGQGYLTITSTLIVISSVEAEKIAWSFTTQ